jgi:hemerythrin-like domain-containing protein
MSDRHGATRVLREEHRLILQVASAFEELLTARSGAAVPLESVGRCITFFRLFADACHHGKEEDLLFTALERHEPDATADAIALMRDEHTFGRSLVATMQAALDEAAAGHAAATRTLADAGFAYIDFIRNHIRREDDGLFDMADQILHGSACRQLCDAYEDACRQRFGGHTVDELQELADAIARSADPRPAASLRPHPRPPSG